MKKLAILMLGLTIATASFAQTTDKTPETSVSITTDQKLKLIVGRESAIATVRLLDAQGHVLYSEQADLQDGLRQNFDLTALDYGTYELSVSVGKERVVKEFVIDDKPAQKIIEVRS
ncbi:hypothetical protein IC229_11825 [Spirosoma sp. BT702]|uniref:T9SS type A sorting domain-containing protein n=1 Tax=Spirosoma profusum TaxID=2771354 RepID=A0A926Y2X8_9BACT|nr:hypothetical protein [Spirosoma profusum]MBD2701330.1 hypothetical protein [Spirosoma profusum]